MKDSNVSRREFLRTSSAAAGAVIASSMFSQSSAQGATVNRPNIVFFYNEAQRADALSLAGNPILSSPNQDRIGREGVYFNNSFCTNALCAPARAVALTGLHSHTSGALDNQTSEALPPDIPIFTDLLRQAGYDVAMVGKAHIGNGVRERYWDYYFAFNAPATDFYNPQAFEGRRGVMGEEKIYKGEFRNEFPDNVALNWTGTYADDLFTDRALNWLKQKRERPFCLLLWLQAPHSPSYRPRRHLDKYNGIPIPKPATFDDDLKGYPGKPRCFANALNKIGTMQTNESVRSFEELVKTYYAGLNAVDDNIGRVIGFLESSGQLDDTVILHSSDHGYYPGTVLLEGKDVSVGRGTDTPFETLGAPWFHAQEVADYLNHRDIPGVRFVPRHFRPTESLYKGEDCQGWGIIMVDRKTFDPVLMGMELLAATMKFHPGKVEPTMRLLGSDEVLANCKPVRLVGRFWSNTIRNWNTFAKFARNISFTSKLGQQSDGSYSSIGKSPGTERRHELDKYDKKSDTGICDFSLCIPHTFLGTG